MASELESHKQQLPTVSEKTTEFLSSADNPLQWTQQRKWTNVILISIKGTLTPIASTILAVAAESLAREFDIASAILPTLPVALFVLGLGLGPLYLAPLSEIYGRRPVYIISFGLFAVLNVGCALAPSLGALSALRLLSGMAGSAGPSLGGASIGDMFIKAERGKAQALYGMGPTGGPILGGVLGGFILNGTGSWRWLMWIMVMAPGVTVICSVFLLRETYAPVLLRKHQKKQSELTTKGVEESMSARSKKARGRIWTNIIRPCRLLVTSPICAVLAFYVALVYGILYLHLLSLSLLFSPRSLYGLYTYGWTDGTSGLSFLGAGVGILVGTFISARFSNRAYAWMNNRYATKHDLANTDHPNAEETAAANSNTKDFELRPESRMLLLQSGMLIIPLGLIIFAWSAGRTHWIVPLIGAALFGTGMIIAYVAFQTYIVDVFGRYAASALATSVILRSVLGCVLTMFGFELYRSLGYAWGTMLLAFLCIAMLPVPITLYVFGSKLRAKHIDL